VRGRHQRQLPGVCLRRNNEEDQLQAAVAQLLDLHEWCWLHVPNGGARDAVTGAILKRLGVKKGFPDVLALERWELGDRSGFGIAIELKAKHGTVKPAQTAWLEALSARGVLAHVCRSMDD